MLIKQTTEMTERERLSAENSNNQYLQALSYVAVGTIYPYAGTVAPDTFMFCDGSALDKTEYAELFEVIGYTYGGSGDTFNIPDLRGRTLVGYNDSDTKFDTVGKKDGEADHTLKVSEIPSHGHQVLAYCNYGGSELSAAGKFVIEKNEYVSWQATERTGLNRGLLNTTEPTGSGQPHNNMPPYIVTNFIIKVMQGSAACELGFVEAINNAVKQNFDEAVEAGTIKGETGDSGVYVGSEEPDDEDVNVWIDPDGEADILSVSVEETESGHTVSISTPNDTKSFEVLNGKDGVKGDKGDKGEKGDTGSAGNDGTSVTVSSVSESVADGGSNVVTFSDGKTVTIKNGSKGNDGDDYVLTNADKKELLVKLQAEVTQQTPLFANSVDECADTTKVYVLPDGYIYAYMQAEGDKPEITIEDGTNGYWQFDENNDVFKWTSSSGWYSKLSNKTPVTPGDQISYQGKMQYSGNKSYAWFDSNNTAIETGLIQSEESPTVLTAPENATFFQCTSFAQNSLSNVVLNVEWILCQASAPTYRWASTGHAFIPADYEDRIVALEKNVISSGGGVLNEKKYVACGDSFTAGPFSEKTEETWSDEYQVYKTYPYWIASRNNMVLVNEAKSGSDFTNISGASNAFSVSRYQSVPTDADYITLMFGLNETSIGSDSALIGTSADTTNATLWGAYNIVFEYFLTNMPFAKIGVIIADAWMTEDYANAVKEICKYWGISYLDLKSEDVPMGIGGRYATTSAKARELRNSAFQISIEDSHPNVKAHEYRSTIIESFLRSL